MCASAVESQLCRECAGVGETHAQRENQNEKRRGRNAVKNLRGKQCFFHRIAHRLRPSLWSAVLKDVMLFENCRAERMFDCARPRGAMRSRGECGGHGGSGNGGGWSRELVHFCRASRGTRRALGRLPLLSRRKNRCDHVGEKVSRKRECLSRICHGFVTY